MFKKSVESIHSELESLGMPPQFCFFISHAARVSEQKLPAGMPAPIAHRDTIYAFVLAGIDILHQKREREIRMNVAENMWKASFGTACAPQFSGIFAAHEIEASRNRTPSMKEADDEYLATYERIAGLAERYWLTPRDFNGAYPAHVSDQGEAPDVPTALPAINCVWRPDRERSIPGVLTTDGTYFGFFEQSDLFTGDLNEGSPMFCSLGFVSNAFLAADMVLGIDQMKFIGTKPAIRNSHLAFSLDDGDLWRFEVSRESFYSTSGYVYRNMFRDFILSLDSDLHEASQAEEL